MLCKVFFVFLSALFINHTLLEAYSTNSLPSAIAAYPQTAASYKFTILQLCLYKKEEELIQVLQKPLKVTLYADRASLIQFPLSSNVKKEISKINNIAGDYNLAVIISPKVEICATVAVHLTKSLYTGSNTLVTHPQGRLLKHPFYHIVRELCAKQKAKLTHYLIPCTSYSKEWLNKLGYTPFSSKTQSAQRVLITRFSLAEQRLDKTDSLILSSSALHAFSYELDFSTQEVFLIPFPPHLSLEKPLEK